jgi:hypothetical protein
LRGMPTAEGALVARRVGRRCAIGLAPFGRLRPGSPNRKLIGRADVARSEEDRCLFACQPAARRAASRAAALRLGAAPGRRAALC